MQDVGKLVLRLTLAILILFHGVDKILHGIAWMQPPIAALHLPSWVAYGVYVGEVIAPLFLILGLAARAAALVIMANMVMAVVLDAYRLAFTINAGGGWGLELEAFYFMSAATLVLLGPGRYRLFGGAKSAAGATGAGAGGSSSSTTVR